MKQLILDFGNTLKKLALFDNDRLILFEYHPNLSLRDLEIFLHSHPGVGEVILASVIHHDKEIEDFLREKVHFISLNSQTPLPVTNLYQSKETQGYDRLAAAVAGHSMFPDDDVLVICAGTALTFDLINRRGEYLGGSISPGMEMRFKALNTFTGKLPLLSWQEPGNLTGNDTRTSILSGVIHGITAEMEGLSRQYQSKYPGIKIILSGGDMNYFVKRLKISIFALPNIVIHGLQQILTFNVHQTR